MQQGCSRTVVSAARSLSVGLLLVAALFAGCGDTGADPPPTVDDLTAMAAAPLPVYWLGFSYRGMHITSAGVGGGGGGLRYGRPICDSGCTYPLTVSSGRGLRAVFPSKGDARWQVGPVCFRRARGGAVLVGCAGSGEFALLTGRFTIYIYLSAKAPGAMRVVDDLVPIRGGPAHFEPPVPLTCRQRERLPGWVAKDLPRVLEPRDCTP